MCSVSSETGGLCEDASSVVVAEAKSSYAPHMAYAAPVRAMRLFYETIMKYHRVAFFRTEKPRFLS